MKERASKFLKWSLVCVKFYPEAMTVYKNGCSDWDRTFKPLFTHIKNKMSENLYSVICPWYIFDLIGFI